MDESLFVIGGINVLVFVPGLVQFVKNVAKLADTAAEVLTVCVGVVCVGTAYAVNSGMIDQPAVGYIELAFIAVAGALSLAGYYKLVAAAGKSFANRVAGSLLR
jgi:hypothetical protein